MGRAVGRTPGAYGTGAVHVRRHEEGENGASGGTRGERKKRGRYERVVDLQVVRGPRPARAEMIQHSPTGCGGERWEM